MLLGVLISEDYVSEVKKKSQQGSQLFFHPEVRELFCRGATYLLVQEPLEFCLRHRSKWNPLISLNLRIRNEQKAVTQKYRYRAKTEYQRQYLQQADINYR